MCGAGHAGRVQDALDCLGGSKHWGVFAAVTCLADQNSHQHPWFWLALRTWESTPVVGHVARNGTVMLSVGAEEGAHTAASFSWPCCAGTLPWGLVAEPSWS